jgi:hypothetical protein
MNQLRNTIFYRMYLVQPNYFLNYGINNNQRFYTEKFERNNITGIFNYHKLVYNNNDINDKDINVYTIIANIAINDMENKINYKEYYEFKNFTNIYTELHELGKHYKKNNYICSYKPLTFSDLPNHIQNFIYMKNDRDIIKNK